MNNMWPMGLDRAPSPDDEPVFENMALRAPNFHAERLIITSRGGDNLKGFTVSSFAVGDEVGKVRAEYTLDRAAGDFGPSGQVRLDVESGRFVRVKLRREDGETVPHDVLVVVMGKVEA